jgi:hypothetical protein
MVRDGKVDTEQLDDGGNQPFGLAQRQPEYSAQGQGRRNRQVRVEALAARRGPRLRPPALDRLRREPDRQAAARPEPRVVRRPVADPMPLLRDVMATRHVGFERHDRS